MAELDPQLAAVEVAIPVIHCIGSGLSFLGILILLIQDGNGDHANAKLETHAPNLLIAGPALWLMDSILNSCQVYERADGHFQILQQLVHIPFLTASVLFLMAGFINHQHQPFKSDHRFELLGRYWVWLGITGSGLLFTRGFANVLKVFKMQNSDMRLEKLRGGAQERLMLERDGQPKSSSSPFATEAWCYPRRKFQPTDPLLLPNYEPTNYAVRMWSNKQNKKKHYEGVCFAFSWQLKDPFNHNLLKCKVFGAGLMVDRQYGMKNIEIDCDDVETYQNIMGCNISDQDLFTPFSYVKIMADNSDQCFFILSKGYDNYPAISITNIWCKDMNLNVFVGNELPSSITTDSNLDGD